MHRQLIRHDMMAQSHCFYSNVSQVKHGNYVEKLRKKKLHILLFASRSFKFKGD